MNTFFIHVYQICVSHVPFCYFYIFSDYYHRRFTREVMCLRLKSSLSPPSKRGIFCLSKRGLPRAQGCQRRLKSRSDWYQTEQNCDFFTPDLTFRKIVTWMTKIFHELDMISKNCQKLSFFVMCLEKFTILAIIFFNVQFWHFLIFKWQFSRGAAPDFSSFWLWILLSPRSLSQCSLPPVPAPHTTSPFSSPSCHCTASHSSPCPGSCSVGHVGLGLDTWTVRTVESPSCRRTGSSTRPSYRRCLCPESSDTSPHTPHCTCADLRTCCPSPRTRWSGVGNFHTWLCGCCSRLGVFWCSTGSVDFHMRLLCTGCCMGPSGRRSETPGRQSRVGSVKQCSSLRLPSRDDLC